MQGGAGENTIKNKKKIIFTISNMILETNRDNFAISKLGFTV